MKVLMLSTDKRIFEPNSYVRQRITEYGDLVEELRVIVLCKSKSAIRDEKLGSVFLHATNSFSRLWSVFESVRVGRAIVRKDNAKWLVTAEDPFETGWAGWQIAKKFFLPLQLQIHTDFLSPYFFRDSFLNKMRRAMALHLIPKAAGIRVVSERIKKSLLAANLKLKTEPIVLPIFVDVQKFKTSLIKISLKKKYPQFDFLILMVSRLNREKNIGLAIKALAEIIKQYPKIGLIIVGEGKEQESLKNEIKGLKVEANVIFEPWADDLASYYKTADLYLLTSNYEGYAMSAVEASACGCPVIMTDVGCAGEVIKDKENGLVMPVNNKKALIDLIIAVHERQIELSSGLSLSVTKLEYLQEYKQSWDKAFSAKS